MLPDYLVSPRYWAAVVEKSEEPQAESSTAETADDEEMSLADQLRHTEQATQAQSLQNYEDQILTGRSWAGQSCNSLLEEQDRHIKERIFCAAKLETFVSVLGVLAKQGVINEQELRQLIDETRTKIASQGNDIWLNLLTRDKPFPLFYQLEDKPRYQQRETLPL